MKLVLKKNFRFLFFTSRIMAVIILTAATSFAQVKFSAIPSATTIARDQALQIEFVLEGAEEMEGFSAPHFDGFTIIQGPQYGNSFSMVNGVVSHSVSITYLLMPQKNGKQIIAPAQTKIKGKIIKSNSVTITVLNQLSGNSTPNNVMPMPGINTRSGSDIKDYILKKGEDPIAKIQKNLVVQVEVSKKSCYEGEPIVVTYKLYTRLKSVSRVTKRPTLNGFSVSELTTPESMDFQPDQLNGKPFYSTVLRKVQLFPLQSGEITLEPIEVSSQVRFLKANEAAKNNNNGFDDIFRDFFDDDMLSGETEEHNLTQQTKPVTITVKPLPENNKPASFNGAVGKFAVQAAMVNSTIAANETGTLKIVIEGKGNLSMINSPVINWPQGIESFEPSSRENIDNSTVPLSGSKTFEYPFTVRDKGNYTLPAVAFSYFNPETQAYETASANSVNFVVNTVAVKKKENKPDYSVQENKKVTDSTNNFFENIINSQWWWPALAILILSWGIYQWRQNRKLAKAKNELKQVIKEKQEAVEDSVPITDGVISTFNTDPLDTARQELKKEHAINFYTELHAALWNFIQQKYQLSPTDMNKKIAADKLRADFFSEEMIEGFHQLLDTCEIALYTPVHSQAVMYQLLQQAETFIKTVEHKIV
ncbi:MAG: BatD family protein [Sphingobacteriales bacterium]